MEELQEFPQRVSPSSIEKYDLEQYQELMDAAQQDVLLQAPGEGESALVDQPITEPNQEEVDVIPKIRSQRESSPLTHEVKTSKQEKADDPPGYVVPQMKQVERWMQFQHDQQQLHGSYLYQSKNRHQNTNINQVNHVKTQGQDVPVIHNFDSYQRRYKNHKKNPKQRKCEDFSTTTSLEQSDSNFSSWVPPLMQPGHPSPVGTPSYFRSQKSQQVFDAAIPKRSWSIDDEKNEKNDRIDKGKYEKSHWKEQGFEDQNSWVMPRMAQETMTNLVDNNDVSIMGTEINNDDHDNEEVFVDEDGNTIVIEEEEIMADVESDEEEKDNKPLENVVVETVISDQSSSFSDNPESYIENTEALPAENQTIIHQMEASKASLYNSMRKDQSNGDEESDNKVTDSVVASSRHSTQSDTRYRPDNRSNRKVESQNSSRKKRNQRDSHANEASFSTRTSATQSTQILYIRDPRDIDPIVKALRSANHQVEIVDEETGEGGRSIHAENISSKESEKRTENNDGGLYIPSTKILILLGFLVALVASSIITGLIIYFA